MSRKSLEDYVGHIQKVKAQLEGSLSSLSEEDHYPRLVFIGQIQILDAILASSRVYLPEESPSEKEGNDTEWWDRTTFGF